MTMDSNWLAWWDLLRVYREERGHASPTQKEEYQGKRLGDWVRKQRAANRKREAGQAGPMSDDRVEKLNELQFVWEPKMGSSGSGGGGGAGNADDPNWLEWWQLLKDYKDEFGTASPPARADYKGKHLGRWVTAQRNRPARVSPWRRAKLDELGFVWDPKPLREEELWMSWWELLKEFKAEKGHVKPGKTEIYKGRKIGDWVSSQRYYHGIGKMAAFPQRIARLNQVGFVWKKGSNPDGSMPAVAAPVKTEEGATEQPSQDGEKDTPPPPGIVATAGVKRKAEDDAPASESKDKSDEDAVAVAVAVAVAKEENDDEDAKPAAVVPDETTHVDKKPRLTTPASTTDSSENVLAQVGGGVPTENVFAATATAADNAAAVAALAQPIAAIDATAMVVDGGNTAAAVAVAAPLVAVAQEQPETALATLATVAAHGGGTKKEALTKGGATATAAKLDGHNSSWLKHDSNWLKWWSVLKEFKRVKGHCSPFRHEHFNDKLIGQWANKQRVLYRRRQKGDPESCRQMNDYRVAKLNELNFEWEPRAAGTAHGIVNGSNVSVLDGQWLVWWQLLKDYQKEKKHASPTFSEEYKGKRLGRWVAHQREFYQQKQKGGMPQGSCQMSDFRMAKLNEINFMWTVRGKSPKAGSKSKGAVKSEEGEDPPSEKLPKDEDDAEQDDVEMEDTKPPADDGKPSSEAAPEDAQDGTGEAPSIDMPDFKLAAEAAEVGVGIKIPDEPSAMNDEESDDDDDDDAIVAGSAKDASWLKWWKLLKRYRKEKGHASPHKTEVYGTERLGQWVNNQRRFYKQREKGDLQAAPHQMSDFRVMKMNQIRDFVWEPRRPSPAKTTMKPNVDSQWLVWWELLKAYKEEHGHASPVFTEVYREKNIGKWCSAQRQHFHLREKTPKENAQSNMSYWRIAKLNELGFAWSKQSGSRSSGRRSSHEPKTGDTSAKNRNEEQWMTWWQLLSDYKDEFGHVSPLDNEIYREKNLGRWVIRQREFYRKKENGDMKPDSARMSETRVSKLNELNFVWTKPRQSTGSMTGKTKEEQWMTWWELLKAYKKEHGHASPTFNEVYREEKLGRWVSQQREARQQREKGDIKPNSSQMSEARISKLNELGMEWVKKGSKDNDETKQDSKSSPRVVSRDAPRAKAKRTVPSSSSNAKGKNTPPKAKGTNTPSPSKAKAKNTSSASNTKTKKVASPERKTKTEEDTESPETKSTGGKDSPEKEEDKESPETKSTGGKDSPEKEEDKGSPETKSPSGKGSPEKDEDKESPESESTSSTVSPEEEDKESSETKESSGASKVLPEDEGEKDEGKSTERKQASRPSKVLPEEQQPQDEGKSPERKQPSRSSKRTAPEEATSPGRNKKQKTATEDAETSKAPVEDAVLLASFEKLSKGPDTPLTSIFDSLESEHGTKLNKEQRELIRSRFYGVNETQEV